MATTNIELLDSILDELDKLKFRDETARDALMKRTAMLLRRICGEKSEYTLELGRIRFHPMYGYSAADNKNTTWKSAVGKLRNLINTIKEEMELFEGNQKVASSISTENSASPGCVFVAHGHDEELKQAAARTLEQLGLDPVILHEKPNKGRTIIEKFDDHTKVEFAVVLLSADDVMQSANGLGNTYRARQNVIFELGFFLGRLGRQNVVAIYRPHESFEMPSDYSGVLFIEYDTSGIWRNKLAKELKACGYSINIEAIL